MCCESRLLMRGCSDWCAAGTATAELCWLVVGQLFAFADVECAVVFEEYGDGD